MKRERRYCQLVNGVSLMYFKEFGAKRDLHKKTAVWAPRPAAAGEHARDRNHAFRRTARLATRPTACRAGCAKSPPCSARGNAEEFNLEFFANGGVPPVMILLQGGTLQAETRAAIERMVSGEAKKNNRIMVIEAEPAGGGLNRPPPQARVTVERFGGDRQSDRMFENYDERCEERVRRAFRLPPIFLGQVKDYTFACYDAETETLTDAGWMKYDGFKPGMRIACYDTKTQSLTYQEPIGGALVYDVENVEMYRFQGESLDLCITRKHRMSWSTQRGVEKLTTIEEMLSTLLGPTSLRGSISTMKGKS